MSDELTTSSAFGSVPAARTTTDAPAESPTVVGLVDRPAPETPPGPPAAPPRAAEPPAEEPAEPVTTARAAMRVVRIALVTALVLNTAGFVRAGVSMRSGPLRDVFLGVGRPLDMIAHAIELDGPRRSLDAAFGHPDDARSGGRTRLEQDAANLPPQRAPQGSGKAAGRVGTPGPVGAATGGQAAGSKPADGAAVPAPTAPHTAPVAAGVRHPTAADPLRILVTGDSLSDFDGQQLAKILTAQGLPAKLRNEPRNGTGLTQPTVFDWADEAATDAATYDPDVVVMVLGANDGWPLHGASAGSDAWVAEYTRRVEAVTRDFLAGDPQRRVYWVGPPVPRSQPWIHIFDRINLAIRAAVPETPGLRYVDVATPTSDHGRYTDYLTGPDGQRVLARQHDGIHYSWPGSVFPARIILAAVEGEFRLG